MVEALPRFQKNVPTPWISFTYRLTPCTITTGVDSIILMPDVISQKRGLVREWLWGLTNRCLQLLVTFTTKRNEGIEWMAIFKEFLVAPEKKLVEWPMERCSYVFLKRSWWLKDHVENIHEQFFSFLVPSPPLCPTLDSQVIFLSPLHLEEDASKSFNLQVYHFLSFGWRECILYLTLKKFD